MALQNEADNATTNVNVFTYGSLMYGDIFLQVTGQQAACIKALADNWSRHGLANRTYPGALRNEEAKSALAGVLWIGIKPAALAALDLFEGAEYRRVQITVRDEAGNLHQAHIYEWQHPDQISGAWDPIEFESLHRRDFARIHANPRN